MFGALLLHSIGTPRARLLGDLMIANLRALMVQILGASLTSIELSGVNKGKGYDRIGSMLSAFDKGSDFAVSTHQRRQNSSLPTKPKDIY